MNTGKLESFQQRGGWAPHFQIKFERKFFARGSEFFLKVCQGPVQCSLVEQDPAGEQGGQVRDQPNLTLKVYYNKFAKLRRHASRVHFAKILFG